MPGATTSHLDQLIRRLRSAPPQITRVAAVEVERAIVEQLSVDTHGSRRLSNLEGGSGLDVVTTPRGDAADVEAVGRGWAILERGTRPHLIPARPQRRSRALLIEGAWRTGPVRVRGSRAKHTFTRGRTIGTGRAITAVNREFEVIVNG